MSLVSRIGPDTIDELERAAPRRFAEADALRRGKRWIGAIYLYGYVAEMVLGAAHFKLLGYSPAQEIEFDRRRQLVQAAKKLSGMTIEAKPHPVDGLAQLLVVEKKRLAPPGHEPELENMIRLQSSLIRDYWSIKLRYRDMIASADDARVMRSAAKWFLVHYPVL